jgi:FkbM family methyltransferase
MVEMKIYESQGDKTKFLWHFPTAELHFIEMLEANPEYQFKVKRMLNDFQDLINFDHVLDIGANVGLWTRWFSRWGAKKIDCFEPLSENIECLVKNTQDLIGVDIHQCALSNAPGTLTLYNSGEQKNSGAATINSDKYLSTAKTLLSYTVNCKPLDSFDLSPTFVKIDVQGAELLVLQGAEQTLKTHKPGLVIECDQGGEILELLSSWGYKKIMERGSDVLLVAS